MTLCQFYREWFVWIYFWAQIGQNQLSFPRQLYLTDADGATTQGGTLKRRRREAIAEFHAGDLGSWRKIDATRGNICR
ncbi:MAG TPA: hypothetical protein IGS17_04290 [Oscillatoriales cyanobacterium M59_W2019_021]|nr:MAG: hypothetical protein D6728_09650 [Cyanobacteria bacterium J055]HIK32698.1 hypothetical protein [Oscillatoriales cyanobacterium M4454_W2019_049]HIK50136.1 hypothetical protein [Oscillatoriales cyanobacterium M59_W2019_021]